MEKRVRTIDLFDSKSEQVFPLDSYFGENKFPVNSTEILSFASNDAGHLVFITADRLITCTDHFEEMAHSLSDFLLIRSIHWSPNGTFWIVTEGKQDPQSSGYNLYILDAQGETLQPSDRFFKLDFALLSFENTPQIQYAYQIEGVDKKTIEQQAEELRSLEQLKSRFFANVSHELRTPLTLMLAPVNTLLKRSGKDSEASKLSQFVQRNGSKKLKVSLSIICPTAA